MKKLIAVLLCNICLLSNSNSSLIVDPLHNIDDSKNQFTSSMLNTDHCSCLNLTKTEYYNSADTNDNSGSEVENIIKDDGLLNDSKIYDFKKNKELTEGLNQLTEFEIFEIQSK